MCTTCCSQKYQEKKNISKRKSITELLRPDMKLKEMVNNISNWVGSEDEAKYLLSEFFNSNLWKTDKGVTHQKIGEVFCDALVSLPSKSPF